jgi:hypothetical protein
LRMGRGWDTVESSTVERVSGTQKNEKGRSRSPSPFYTFAV